MAMRQKCSQWAGSRELLCWDDYAYYLCGCRLPCMRTDWNCKPPLVLLVLFYVSLAQPNSLSSCYTQLMMFIEFITVGTVLLLIVELRRKTDYYPDTVSHCIAQPRGDLASTSPISIPTPGPDLLLPTLPCSCSCSPCHHPGLVRQARKFSPALLTPNFTAQLAAFSSFYTTYTTYTTSWPKRKR